MFVSAKTDGLRKNAKMDLLAFYQGKLLFRIQLGHDCLTDHHGVLKASALHKLSLECCSFLFVSAKADGLRKNAKMDLLEFYQGKLFFRVQLGHDCLTDHHGVLKASLVCKICLECRSFLFVSAKADGLRKNAKMDLLAFY